MPADRSTGTVKNFEDFHVYGQARDLTNDVYRLTRSGAFAKDFGLADQIRRAAVSILSNIAEGYERGSSTEFIQFLYIAKGSCGEVRAQLSVASDQGYVPADLYERLKNRCRLISGMLNNLLEYLRGSRFTGAKFKPAKRNWVAEAMQEQVRVLNELAEARKKAQEQEPKP